MVNTAKIGEGEEELQRPQVGLMTVREKGASVLETLFTPCIL